LDAYMAMIMADFESVGGEHRGGQAAAPVVGEEGGLSAATD
jgi:hypothetical protein